MCFIGDFRYPRKFSRFIRLCLYVGIEVVFIAPSSPWMNGSIENFNNWFGAKFWDKETFTSLKAMGINLDKLPLTDGKIHFIRKVDNKARINVLNEVFEVGKAFISEYVWATICMGKRKMEVYYRAKDQDAAVLIKEFNYELNEEVEPLRDDIWKT